jgi:hypothetical protein
MLIINRGHLMRAGVCNLDEPCPYCGFAYTSYPLIMSDDVEQTVYHVTCALQLAADLLTDLLHSSIRQLPTPVCSRSQNIQSPRTRKEAAMQSTDLKEIIPSSGQPRMYNLEDNGYVHELSWYNHRGSYCEIWTIVI